MSRQHKPAVRTLSSHDPVKFERFKHLRQQLRNKSVYIPPTESEALKRHKKLFRANIEAAHKMNKDDGLDLGVHVREFELALPTTIKNTNSHFDDHFLPDRYELTKYLSKRSDLLDLYRGREIGRDKLMDELEFNFRQMAKNDAGVKKYKRMGEQFQRKYHSREQDMKELKDELADIYIDDICMSSLFNPHRNEIMFNRYREAKDKTLELEQRTRTLVEDVLNIAFNCDDFIFKTLEPIFKTKLRDMVLSLRSTPDGVVIADTTW